MARKSKKPSEEEVSRRKRLKAKIDAAEARARWDLIAAETANESEEPRAMTESSDPKSSTREKHVPQTHVPAIDELPLNTEEDRELRRIADAAREHGITSLEQARVEHERRTPRKPREPNQK